MIDEEARRVWFNTFGNANVVTDRYGSKIRYSEYGNDKSPYCWEIEHKWPSSRGGKDTLSNLEPAQIDNNKEKSDNVGLTRINGHYYYIRETQQGSGIGVITKY